ncbi:MAG: Gfo/Idh/MocA family oxidoreductase [Bacteroidetes bacterium]|nr:Gfo/Idh/MocA family oxidoreductase [Bacteroidota bacterium]MBS1633512.1 Gfo/Idh/MocA family oxidoreductase [Bacteroidota bacterium]
MVIKALIIGCGNIGALYDLNDPKKVWTHAKAFSRTKGIDFVIADTDNKILEKISKQYKVSSVKITDDFDYAKFDIVSITTPTPTHFDYLQGLMTQNVPVIICEKPVAASVDELNILLQLHGHSKSKVLVNYIRRFQPEYSVLKKRISAILKNDSCRAIAVKYQRGFLNNGGHAFDLLEFLFDRPVLFEKFHVQSAVFDAFDYDPTITATCNYYDIPVSITGVTNAAYPVFEIELFFQKQKIVICHSGDEIRYYAASKKIAPLSENKKLRQTGILKEYMLPVVEVAKYLLKKNSNADNFIQAAELNRRMVNLLPVISK